MDRVVFMKKRLQFRVGKIINESIYFSCDEFSGLFKLDIAKQEVNFLSFFPGEDVLQRFLHAKVLSFEEYLIFIPGSCGKNIHIYDYSTGCIKYVPCFSERGWEGDAFISDGYLWMIPSAFGRQLTVRMDLKTLQVEELQGFFGDLSDKYWGDEAGRMLKRVAFDGEFIWFAILHSNKIIRISICDKRIKTYDVNIKDLFGVFMTCSELWLVSYSDECIYKWNPKTNGYEKCKVQESKKNLIPSNNIFEIGREIFALPYLSEFITRYNAKTHCFEKWVEYPDKFQFIDSENPKFWNYDYDQNRIICFPVNAKDILLINIKENRTLSYRVDIDKDKSREPYRSIGKASVNERLLIESSDIILKDYIQYIEIEKKEEQLGVTDSIGEKIYQFSL